MEGTIPNFQVQLFKNRISEGTTIYKLGAYQVQYARERYKTVDRPWRVVFAQKTTVEPIVPQPPNFPKYGYTTYNVHSTKAALNKLFCCQLPASQEYLRRAADRLTRYEKITSQIMPAVVMFWGKLADALDADKLQRWSAQEPIIVLFVGMPVHEFNET